MPILFSVLCLLFAAVSSAAEDIPLADSPYWAVVTITDPTGASTIELMGLSQSGAGAAEIKAVQAQLEEALKTAKAAWDERRKVWEADKANSGKSFRKVEAEPGKPSVKINGSAFKDRAKAEVLLAQARDAELRRTSPGLARRRQVINEQLLQYFTLGIQASPEWIIETRDKHGARWAVNAGYLSHVVNTPNDIEGKDTAFFKYNQLRRKLEGCRTAKVICWNTWYGLAEAPPALYKPTPAAATPVNAKVKSTMIAYWQIYKKALLMAKEFEDVDCVMQIEPDEWGHLLLSCGFDFNKDGVVLVGGSGMPELKGIPDTVKGWSRAFRLLRDLYAPHVILAANPSAWDWHGRMSGEAWGGYLNGMEVNLQNGWDLFITQLHDWDRGQARNGAKAKYPPYTEADTVSRFESVDNWCSWTKPIHEATGMWGVAWQLPQGNWTYATVDGSDGHAMDNVTELLLENHPKNRVAERMVASGVCMWIYSLGGDGANVTDAKKDGITNPKPYPGNKGKKSEYPDDDGGYLRLKGAEYFRNPVPILGKPIAQKGKKAEKAEEKPKPKPDPVSQPEARQAVQLTDPAARAVWVERLRGQVMVELAAKREPQFIMSAFKARAILRGLDAAGMMTLSIEGAGEMTSAWKRLSDRDLANLAVALARPDESERQALAAFFLFLAGDADAARGAMLKAGTSAAEVEGAFSL
ncbi:MAG TPA: hypothetical protein DCS97_03870 [Planctomycetes bacterium]|nr:hypothetical protein [Planctomycetota bacterium]